MGHARTTASLPSPHGDLIPHAISGGVEPHGQLDSHDRVTVRARGTHPESGGRYVCFDCATTRELHDRLTPEQRDEVQEWLFKRHEQLWWPAGIRRKTDTGHSARLSLRAWRRRLGLTMTDLVRLMRHNQNAHGPLVCVSVIRALESGKTEWKYTRYLKRIAAALNIPVESILLRDDHEPHVWAARE